MFVTTLDAHRLFIGKEFYQSAGKLHLAFATVRDLFERLAARVKGYREGGGFLHSLFRTFIASNPLHDQAAVAALKKALASLEHQVRYFEQSFIALARKLLVQARKAREAMQRAKEQE